MKTGSVHVSKGRFSTRRQMFSRGCRGIEAGDDRTVLCHDGDFNLLDEIEKLLRILLHYASNGNKGNNVRLLRWYKEWKIREEVFEGSYGLYYRSRDGWPVFDPWIWFIVHACRVHYAV